MKRIIEQLKNKIFWQEAKDFLYFIGYLFLPKLSVLNKANKELKEIEISFHRKTFGRFYKFYLCLEAIKSLLIYLPFLLLFLLLISFYKSSNLAYCDLNSHSFYQFHKCVISSIFHSVCNMLGDTALEVENYLDASNNQSENLFSYITMISAIQIGLLAFVLTLGTQALNDFFKESTVDFRLRKDFTKKLLVKEAIISHFLLLACLTIISSFFFWDKVVSINSLSITIICVWSLLNLMLLYNYIIKCLRFIQRIPKDYTLYDTLKSYLRLVKDRLKMNVFQSNREENYGSREN